MTKTLDKTTLQENLLKQWNNGEKWELRNDLDFLLSNPKYLSPGKVALLEEYRNLFTWKEEYYVKCYYSVQCYDYKTTTKCSSLEEAKQYMSGDKVIEFPDESKIDWFEEDTPELTGDCHQEIKIRTHDLELKNPPEKKTYKVVFLVTTENGSTGEDIHSEVESVLKGSELLDSSNSCLEVTEHED